MNIEQFRKQGKEMVDFICDYYENIEKLPVKSQVSPGYLRKLIPENPPKEGEKWEDIMSDVKQKIVPGVTHWQHPSFFAYFPANSSPSGILGEMLSACFNCVGFSWVCSPACTELETIMLDWMHEILDLPKCFHSSSSGGGVIEGTASEASLCAMLAARAQVLDEYKRKKGKKELTEEEFHDVNSKLVAYVSDQTHSSVKKGCMISGIEYVRKIPSNHQFEMDCGLLKEQLSKDLKSNLIPFFVCATIGTTSSASNDDLVRISKVVREESKCNMWIHVDAAYAGSFMILPEFRKKYLIGLENCDSYNFNPHKMLLVNFDCSLLWVRNRRSLINALSITPEYLRSKEYEKNLVFDYRDWQIPLGRRFRSLKLWFVMRTYGVEGLRKFVSSVVEMSVILENMVNEDSRFEIMAKRHYSLLCFRLKSKEKEKGEDYLESMNQYLEEKVVEKGKIFIVHTKLKGRYVLRFAIGARLTRIEHVKNGWSEIQKAASETLKEFPEVWEKRKMEKKK